MPKRAGMPPKIADLLTASARLHPGCRGNRRSRRACCAVPPDRWTAVNGLGSEPQRSPRVRFDAHCAGARIDAVIVNGESYGAEGDARL